MGELVLLDSCCGLREVPDVDRLVVRRRRELVGGAPGQRRDARVVVAPLVREYYGILSEAS